METIKPYSFDGITCTKVSIIPETMIESGFSLSYREYLMNLILDRRWSFSFISYNIKYFIGWDINEYKAVSMYIDKDILKWRTQGLPNIDYDKKVNEYIYDELLFNLRKLCYWDMSMIRSIIGNYSDSKISSLISFIEENTYVEYNNMIKYSIDNHLHVGTKNLSIDGVYVRGEDIDTGNQYREIEYRQITKDLISNQKGDHIAFLLKKGNMNYYVIFQESYFYSREQPLEEYLNLLLDTYYTDDEYRKGKIRNIEVVKDIIEKEGGFQIINIFYR